MEGPGINTGLLQISTHQVDEVFGEFGSDLLFGAIDEVKADVGFKYLGHKAVDATANSSEQHQLVSAILIAGQGALDGVKLTAEFARTLQELDGFTFILGHGFAPLDNTLPGYGIY